jgi:hypothetical protein
MANKRGVDYFLYEKAQDVSGSFKLLTRHKRIRTVATYDQEAFCCDIV